MEGFAAQETNDNVEKKKMGPKRERSPGEYLEGKKRRGGLVKKV